MPLTIRRKLFFSHFVAVVFVSGSIGTLFYQVAVSSMMDGLRARLMGSAAMLARALDARKLADIRGPADMESPSYREQLALLRELQATNADIAFAYVMRKEGERITFVLDTDQSTKQAKPGKEYDYEMPSLERGFRRQAADDAILCDEWGCFLSGYAPLENGAGQYLVGIDMRADEVQNKLRDVRIAGAVSLLVSFLLAYFGSSIIAPRLTRPIGMLAARTAEIAEGKLEGRVDVEKSAPDELAALGASFNTMSERLAESNRRKDQAMADLEEARAHLEVRVKERTAELAGVNEQLRGEIEERKRAEDALRVAATTDYLTGLLNRRAILMLLEHEAARIQRASSGAALLLVDMDHFKRVNDQFGHDAGDRVLEQGAMRLRKSLRKQDAVARWGGEEILVLLPETSLAGAMEVAEKVRRAFHDEPSAVAPHRIAVTASIGVSTLSQDSPIDAAIRDADVALYKAKSGGRNRVVGPPGANGGSTEKAGSPVAGPAAPGTA